VNTRAPTKTLHGQSARMIFVEASTAGREDRIAWISLQPGGSISVGLRDSTFISPKFHARMDLFNIDNRVAVRYLVPDDPNALTRVVNPHLTFHPAMEFHLRANGDALLFVGSADAALIVDGDGYMPWVRFVSRRVADLPTNTNSGKRHGSRGSSVITLPLASAECSVGLAIDFVRPATAEPSGRSLDHFADSGDYRIRISCEALPSQPATLAWYHQY
jgi:hypothetical protein